MKYFPTCQPLLLTHAAKVCHNFSGNARMWIRVQTHGSTLAHQSFQRPNVVLLPICSLAWILSHLTKCQREVQGQAHNLRTLKVKWCRTLRVNHRNRRFILHLTVLLQILKNHLVYVCLDEEVVSHIVPWEALYLTWEGYRGSMLHHQHTSAYTHTAKMTRKRRQKTYFWNLERLDWETRKWYLCSCCNAPIAGYIIILTFEPSF